MDQNNSMDLYLALDFEVFTQSHQLFQQGNNKSSLISSSKFKGQILVHNLDFFRKQLM